MARFSKSSVVGALERIAANKHTPSPFYCNLEDKDWKEHQEFMYLGQKAAAESLLAAVKETKRFSRKSLAELIQARIDQVQEEHGFDYRNGYAQIRARRGDERMWRDYGRFNLFRWFAEDTGTSVDPRGTGFSPVRVSPRVTIYRRLLGDEVAVI
jgi:hypothetical protein